MQGQGMGSAEERVKSEVAWMKSEFSLDANQEKRLHDVLLKYEKPGTKSVQSGQSGQGASSVRNQEEKDKEIKAIIGDQNFQIYKQKEAERKGTGTSKTPAPDKSNPNP
jgi:hypothetical protein